MSARAGTEVEAANLALGHLKQPPIAQLADNSDRARAVNAVFAAARDAALRQKSWNFATGYDSPSKINVAYAGRFSAVYALPDDCLKVRSVIDATADTWEVLSYSADPAGSAAEVAVLATDLTAPKICFTRRIDAPRLWDAEFLICFGFRLAQFAGAPFVSPTRLQYLGEQADKWRDDAAIDDAQEAAPRTLSRSSSWTRARRIGGSRGWLR